MTGSDGIDVRVRTARVVTAAFAMGVLTFTAVAVVLVSSGAMAPAGWIRTSLPLLAALGAAVLLVLAPVLQRRILDAGAEEDEEALQGRWMSATIAAMGDARGRPGLLGIAVSLVAGSAVWALGFGVASVGAIALAWPRGEDLRERLRRVRARN